MSFTVATYDISTYPFVKQSPGTTESVYTLPPGGVPTTRSITVPTPGAAIVIGGVTVNPRPDQMTPADMMSYFNSAGIPCTLDRYGRLTSTAASAPTVSGDSTMLTAIGGIS